MFKDKKAEMGVGTLIVFIAMLLVAAIAAGVLIQTASSLQEKALATGQQARSQISTNARVIEVSATDGRYGNLSDFQQIMKLSPGSDPIKLDQIIFTFNTKDATSTLHYRGTSGICEKNNVDGYNTWYTESLQTVVNITAQDLEDDYDNDGIDDTIYITTPGAAVLNINLSASGVQTVNLGVNLSNASGTPIPISVARTTVTNGTDTVLYVTVSGTTATNDAVDAGIISIEPYRLGEGYFVAIYEQTGTNYVAGNLQRGDVVRFCYEAPGDINEDMLVRLNFIPKIGTPTLTQFVTPDVISTERVYLYP